MPVRFTDALHVDIGLLAGDVQGVEGDPGISHGGVQSAIAAQVHACDRHGEIFDARFAAHLIGLARVGLPR